MLFNSYLFIFAFLPVALLLYFGINKLGCFTIAKVALTIMSVIFYGYNNPRYAVIFIMSIVVNYCLHCLLMKDMQKAFRKLCLIVGVCFNLGWIGYFKYLGFFMENVNAIFGWDFVIPNIVLPLGISFYTFQQVSFVIDSYYKTTPKYGFVDYALFVAFFPQLIAGPIVLHGEIVPQFQDETKKKINYENIAAGIRYFAMGMSKKVLIADYFGKIVDAGYADIWGLNSMQAVVVMLAYTIQLYFDFSGYSDMAIGLGKFFNIDIPINFDSPYKAASIGEFWKGWNITLTRFFTTYLYIPLGGSRKGMARTCVNTMIVLTVSGLWHGADWSFVLWGFMLGLAMVLYRLNRGKIKVPRWLGFIGTFAFVSVSGVFFRADSIGQAVSLFGRMLKGGFGIVPWSHLLALAVVMAIVLFAPNTHERVKNKALSWKIALADIVLLVVSIFWLSEVAVFLYFNF